MSNESTALAKQNEAPAGSLIQMPPQPQGLTPTVVPLDRDTLAFYGNMITSAGLVPVSGNVSPEVAKFRVMAKIVAGVSYGFDPVLSQQCFDVMFNAMTPNARCMEILFKDTGEYDWRTAYLNDTGCKLKILKRQNGTWDAGRGQYVGGEWTVIGEVEFTVDMAKKAGLWDKKDSLWPKYAQDMAFARCVTRAVKRFNPGCMRPRTLLGNVFAKQAPQIAPTPDVPTSEPVPQIPEVVGPAEPQTEATEQQPTPTAAAEVYEDPPFIEDDDGIEAEVVEYGEAALAGPDGVPSQFVDGHTTDGQPIGEEVEAEPVDPDESRLIDLRDAVRTALSEKVGGMASDQKTFLRGRIIENESVSVLEEMLETLNAM